MNRTHYGHEETGRLVLRVSEVQRLLDLSRGSVYKGLASGDIPSIRVGRRLLVPRVQLEKMLDEAGIAGRQVNND